MTINTSTLTFNNSYNIILTLNIATIMKVYFPIFWTNIQSFSFLNIVLFSDLYNIFNLKLHYVIIIYSKLPRDLSPVTLHAKYFRYSIFTSYIYYPQKLEANHHSIHLCIFLTFITKYKQYNFPTFLK